MTSPIARALIGKTRGETVEVEPQAAPRSIKFGKSSGLGAPDKSMN